MYDYNISAKFDDEPLRARHVRVMALDLVQIRYFSLVRSLSKKVFIGFSPDVVKMCMTIISRPSLIMSHLAPGMSELWPLTLLKFAILALFSQ